jgi:hypothetical protein
MTSRTGKPIVIAEYDPAWVPRFEAERAMILRACGPDAFVRIEHVGSTSVPGLAAKPIIDIMPGVRSLEGFAAHIEKIVALGYEYVPEYERDTAAGPGMPFRRYFRKDVEELTLAEARAFLEYDRKISPGTPGKLTAPVQRKYVEAPLNSAGVARGGGDLVRARKLVAEVLAVDPQNPDALKLSAELTPDAGR